MTSSSLSVSLDELASGSELTRNALALDWIHAKRLDLIEAFLPHIPFRDPSNPTAHVELIRDLLAFVPARLSSPVMRSIEARLAAPRTDVRYLFGASSPKLGSALLHLGQLLLSSDSSSSQASDLRASALALLGSPLSLEFPDHHSSISSGFTFHRLLLNPSVNALNICLSLHLGGEPDLLEAALQRPEIQLSLARACSTSSSWRRAHLDPTAGTFQAHSFLNASFFGDHPQLFLQLAQRGWARSAQPDLAQEFVGSERIPSADIGKTLFRIAVSQVTAAAPLPALTPDHWAAFVWHARLLGANAFDHLLRSDQKVFHSGELRAPDPSTTLSALLYLAQQEPLADLLRPSLLQIFRQWGSLSAGIEHRRALCMLALRSDSAVSEAVEEALGGREPLIELLRRSLGPADLLASLCEASPHASTSLASDAMELLRSKSGSQFEHYPSSSRAGLDPSFLMTALARSSADRFSWMLEWLDQRDLLDPAAACKAWALSGDVRKKGDAAAYAVALGRSEHLQALLARRPRWDLRSAREVAKALRSAGSSKTGPALALFEQLALEQSLLLSPASSKPKAAPAEPPAPTVKTSRRL